MGHSDFTIVVGNRIRGGRGDGRPEGTTICDSLAELQEAVEFGQAEGTRSPGGE